MTTRVSALYYYPIKSLGGIRIETASVKYTGIEFDRRWMLIDEENRFLSQRELNEMCLFRIEDLDATFKITHSIKKTEIELGKQSLVINKLKARIWNDEVEVSEVSETHNQYFSDLLNKKCRLVFKHKDSIRSVDKTYSKSITDEVNFSDGFPVLLNSQSSFDLLSEKLGSPVEHERFRPNIVVDNCTPHEEDSFKDIKIGEVILSIVKPCARCLIPTINPKTGEKSHSLNKTLATYRVQKNQILFGQNCLVKKEGVIKVGEFVAFN